MGAIEAFWLTLLFDTVRGATRAWRSSNPTWVKSRRYGQPAKLYWRRAVGEAYQAAISATPIAAVNSASSRVVLGTSTDLSRYGIEPDLVLGSPPYCTRIDYAIATRIELSVLGFTFAEQLELRRALIGTTTVPPSSRLRRAKLEARLDAHWMRLPIIRPRPRLLLLEMACPVFRRVRSIPCASGASHLTNRGNRLGCARSYYKELHLDLAQITAEILAAFGWQLYHSYTFATRHSFAQINPRAIAYRNNAKLHERALFFRLE